MKIKLAALALILTLTSCSAPAASPSGGITVMGKKSDMEKTYMTAIFDRYEDLTGKKLTLIEVDDVDFEAAAKERMSSDSPPDVLLHFHNADLDDFEVKDSFLYLNGQPWVSELTDSALAYCLDADGNLLGLPFWESSVSGCYYNKTVLDSLGFRPAATQAEFDTMCQALTDLGMTPICWPGDGCYWMVQFALDPVFADDPELLERLNKNEVSFSDIPAVLSMARWIENAAHSGWLGDERAYRSTGWDGISAALSSGDALMAFIWDTWFYTDFKPGKYTDDDFALMPVFMGTDDSGTYEGGNLNMMMVNKRGPRVDEALEFLAFCATPENYNAAFSGISTVSCFKGQTTNIQSKMVTDAAASLARYERVSTASTRIIGYSADDVYLACDVMLRGDTDAKGFVELMDGYRIAAAKAQNAAGFQ